MLSPPLVVMTVPLSPPCPPLIVSLDATTVRIKMYAPEYGTFKYLLQLRALTNFPGNPLRGLELGNTNGTGSGLGSGQIPGVSVGKNNTILNNGTVGANSDINTDGWVNVYYGMETLYTCTTMHSNAEYESRYFAVNCQGNVSEPSLIQSFITLHRSNTMELLTYRNVENSFTLECTGDIVVGDTILMTERLFSKSYNNDHDITGPLGMGNSGIRMNSNFNRSSQSISGKNKNKVGNVSRLNMSTTSQSMQSISNQSYNTNTNPESIFIGERTIAAYVTKDNYKSSRNEIELLGITPKDIRKFGKYRRLWLEVVWQKSSNEACKKYELKPGSVIERQQAHLEQFEVFRCQWRTENMRKPLYLEWGANRDCYLQTDC